ncbi:hypothetical protein WCE41_12910 [Luteimonas sp. MJ246]|uniref:hypothetical protein n=1 Tax=Luteimonas sp. MJ174 TaxID=3129237 RepID=UPI0031B9EA72
MSRTTRRSLLRNALATLIALDLMALASLLANQWFEASAGLTWGIVMALSFPAFSMSLSTADAVMAMADRYAGVPDAGEQIPQAGQSCAA